MKRRTLLILASMQLLCAASSQADWNASALKMCPSLLMQTVIGVA